jgi:hypothetical protein
METQEMYKTVIIREYLWNCGDGGGIIDTFYEIAETNGDDVNIEDYWYIVEFIDDFCVDIIREFDDISHLMSEIDFSSYIDDYEGKIEKRIKSNLIQSK